MTPPQVRLRPAGVDDIRSVILPIEKQSQPHPWTEKAFLAEMDNPVSELTLAEDHRGCPAGFLVTWHIADEIHILNVAVAPAHRRKGIGRFLVKAILERALDEGAAWVSLEVRVSNSAAIALYESLGFVLVGRRAAYYADNDEDALVLGWTPETGGAEAIDPSRAEPASPNADSDR